MYPASELILRPDNSVYHLGLQTHQIATTIITVGDPERVGLISRRFDRIEHQTQHREFRTETGVYKGKRLTVISTGIGTDNIDIVLNELDALVNIDLGKRKPKENLTRLNFVRVGTSGALQADAELDTLMVSRYALSLDGLMPWYDLGSRDAQLLELQDDLERSRDSWPCEPLLFQADKSLLEILASDLGGSITLTCAGFYAPQDRELRYKRRYAGILKDLSTYRHRSDAYISNLEMETAGIYGLSEVLGHRAISFNAILANRMTGEFSQNPGAVVEQLIDFVLERLVKM